LAKEAAQMKLKKSSLIVKLIVLAIAVYATITLVSMQSNILTADARKSELQSKVGAARVENQKLQNEIDEYSLQDNTEKIAREKLGLVSQGEILIYDTSN